jgi:hypothetical protein
LSGTLAAAQFPALTGAITTTAGSLATTLSAGAVGTSNIAASAVTYAKIQNETASTLLGNPTGSAAAPSEITLGSGLSFSGSTLTATGGGSVSLTSTSAALVASPSPITGTGSFALTNPINTQSGASYSFLSTDATKTVNMTNGSATTTALPVATTSGFTTGFATSLQTLGAGDTLSATTSTINGITGSTGIKLGAYQEAGIQSDGTNYQVSLGVPQPATQTGSTFLRDDMTWQTPTGSGTVNSAASGLATYYASSGTAVSGQPDWSYASNNLIGNQSAGTITFPGTGLASGLLYAGANGTTSGFGAEEYQNGTSSAQGAFITYTAGGTPASPAALGSGVSAGGFSAYGWNGSAFAGAGSFYCQTTQAWTTGAEGSACFIGTNANGATSTTANFKLDQNGALLLPASAANPGANGLAVMGPAALGGTITAPSLSTSGTVAGSLCQTSAGLFLYESGVNCFGSGTPVSFTGTTTGSANTYLLTTVPSSGLVLSNQPVIEVAFNAANTGASTINVDSTGAVAIDVQTPLGLSALVGGEIAAGNTMRTLQYNSAASVYVLKNQLGSPVSNPCTSQTITAAQWAAGFTCTITAASQTLTFPAVTTLSPQGGVFINSVGQYFTVTPAAADGINAGSVNTSVVFGPGSYTVTSSGTSGGTTSTGLQVAGGARAIPIAISWLPGQNLAAAALPIANLQNTNGWMISKITCTPEVVAGGTATIDLWEAPSGTALGSGGSTKLTTTSCNANTGAGSDQPLLSSPVAVPAGDRIGIIATGAGFTSSPLGAGVLTATLQQ